MVIEGSGVETAVSFYNIFQRHDRLDIRGLVDMKNVIKTMIPKRTIPIAQRIYWKYFINWRKPKLSKKQYNELTALKCIVSYNKYGGYCIPESSRYRPAASIILSMGVYEPETIDFIVSNCGDGDIVHAGAYFGDFLPALAKGMVPSAQVWAFEPNSESYRCARITLEINDVRNVTLLNAGLGSKQETLLLTAYDENGRSLGGGSRIIGRGSNKGTGVEEVKIVAIDDIVSFDRNVSIIQLDVEGYKEEALRGALKTIQRCLPIIIVEVLPSNTLPDNDWFSENILSLGYRKIKNVHKNSVFSCS